MFVKPGVNNLAHALITLFLCGLWIPVWIIITISNNGQPYRCTQCGSTDRPVASAGSNLKVLLIVAVVCCLVVFGAMVFFAVDSVLGPALERARKKAAATTSTPSTPAAPARRREPHTNPPAIRIRESTPPVAPIEAAPVVEEKPAPVDAPPVAVYVDRRKIANDAAAFKFHFAQAQSGNVGSMARLGHFYLTGTGCETNVAQGKLWLEKAADAGNDDAKEELSRLPK